MSAEELGHSATAAREGLDDVEGGDGFLRRRFFHRTIFDAALQLFECAGESLGVSRDFRAGLVGCVFARAADAELDERGRYGRNQDCHQHQQRVLVFVAAAAKDAAKHHDLGDHLDGACDRGDDGAGEDIPVLDVAHFVPKHAAQFAVSEQSPDPGCHRHHAMLGVAAGSKGVGRIRFDDVNARHGHARSLGDFAHHREKVGFLRLHHFFGARHAQCHLVAEPIGGKVHDAGEDKEQGRAASAADQPANGDEDARERCQQQGGL